MALKNTDKYKFNQDSDLGTDAEQSHAWTQTFGELIYVIFSVEDNGSKSIWNTGDHPWDYVVSKLWRLQSTSSLLWKPQISYTDN